MAGYAAYSAINWFTFYGMRHYLVRYGMDRERAIDWLWQQYGSDKWNRNREVRRSLEANQRFVN